MNELKLVVFDLAGTTVKDKGEVVDAFTAALSDHKLAITPEQLMNIRGASKRQAILHLVPEGPDREQISEMVYLSFCKHLAERFKSGSTQAIDGAEEVFQLLREHEVRVALNTGFDRDITNLLLGALNWNEAIVDAVVCGDDVKHGRPAPDMIYQAMEATSITRVQEVANVGDTVLDLRAGFRAGVRWNVGVLTGAHNLQLMQLEPHTHLIQSVMDLIPEVFPGSLF